MEWHASNFHGIVSVCNLFAFDDFSFLSDFTKYRIKHAILKLHIWKFYTKILSNLFCRGSKVVKFYSLGHELYGFKSVRLKLGHLVLNELWWKTSGQMMRTYYNKCTTIITSIILSLSWTIATTNSQQQQQQNFYSAASTVARGLKLWPNFTLFHTKYQKS